MSPLILLAKKHNDEKGQFFCLGEKQTGIAFLIKIWRRRIRIPGRKKMIARYAHIAMETPRYEFSKSDGECTHLIFLHIFSKGAKILRKRSGIPGKTENHWKPRRNAKNAYELILCNRWRVYPFNFPQYFEFERQFVNREKFIENWRVAEKSGKLFCN